MSLKYFDETKIASDVGKLKTQLFVDTLNHKIIAMATSADSRKTIQEISGYSKKNTIDCSWNHLKFYNK